MFKGFQALRTLCALTAAVGAAEAQTLVRTHPGDQANDLFGSAVAPAGDVDADGMPDYLVGAAEDGAIFQERPGYARVFSGATGSVIRTHGGEADFDHFGTAVAGAGNTNPGQDGADDYVIGAHFHSPTGQNLVGKVYCYSGATGGQRWAVLGADDGDELGFAVAGGGDLSGDGIPDVAAGAPRADTTSSSAGYVVGLSGVDGSELWRLDGTVGNGRLGTSVCVPGNLNPLSDSRADVVVGSLNDGVKVLSGVDGSVLYTLNGLASTDVYGISVASIADVTGDGVPEIVVGAPQTNFIAEGEGYVEVRNGATGALVFRNQGDTVGEGYGSAVACAGDWNADGFEDVVVSVRALSSAVAIRVDVVSGLDGALLDTLTPGAPQDREGQYVAGIGDGDGDGRFEILLGAPQAADGGVFSGRAVVYESEDQVAGCTGDTSIFCTSNANSTGDTADLVLVGSTSVADDDFVLVSTDLPTNQPGVFYYGDNPSPTPFGNGVRCVGPGNIRRLGPADTGPAGLAALNVDLAAIADPNTTIVGGSTWYFQFWFRDPDAFDVNFSNGLQVDFCD